MFSYFSWSFFTDKHDIKFSVSYKDRKGNEEFVAAPERLSVSYYHEDGRILCQSSTVCTYTFVVNVSSES